MSKLQKNTLIISIALAYCVLWLNAPEMAAAITLAGGAIWYSSSCISGDHDVDYKIGQPVERSLNND